MKYLLLFTMLFFSCSVSHLPKEYRQRQRKINRNAKVERRMLSNESDTTHFRWYPLTDSSLIGTPRIIK